MFEFEVDHATLSSAEIPLEIQGAFAESRGTIRSFSILAWEEHCTECAMPQCYSTCDLYVARKDGKCRRFQYGFGYVKGVPSILGYASKVAFKRWGQLMTYANAFLVPVDEAIRLEATIAATDRRIAKIPDSNLSILGRSGLSTRLRRRYKQRLSHRVPSTTQGTTSRPDCFMVEIYNPMNESVKMTLIVRDANGALNDRPYQSLLKVLPGFNRFRVPYVEIERHIDVSRQFQITLCPNLLNPSDEGLTLYFGLIAFVTEYPKTISATANSPLPYSPGKLRNGEKYAKVVAWDLDNTLWEGILIEDGEDNLHLKEGIVDVIKELDRRGIVNSIISKNDRQVALPALKRMGISDYFVFPQISWNPKSNAVLDLVSYLNVGTDTVVVIDDSAFERSEIATRCPGVRVYAEDICNRMLDLPEFRPELSEESSKRREFYRTEELRITERDLHHDDYLSFLKGCQIRAIIDRADDNNINRLHELIQRTNQLNYSGNRYTREAIGKLITDPALLPICVSCSDKFGDYGLVGFCLLNRQLSTVQDMMFSCRVQSKHVEHAVLCELMKFQRSMNEKVLRCLYKKTAKNTAAVRVFEDLHFNLDYVGDDKATHVFSYSLEQPLPEQNVIIVDWRVIE